MPTDFQISIPEMKVIQRAVKRASAEDATRAAKIATTEMTKIYLPAIKAIAPVGRTGVLKKSIKRSVRKAKTFVGWLGRVGILRRGAGRGYPNYAIYLERGTDPHRIKAKGRLSALAFGGFVRREVQHPGIDAKPFIEPVFKGRRRDALRKGSRVFVREIRKTIK